MKDQRLYHTVASRIEKLIEKGEFPPGSRLPAERELAERFSVSRVTVREAEIALQAAGRVNIKTGSGVYVLEAKAPESDELPTVSAFELTEARSLIEAETAALAATNVDDETLEKLAGYVDIMAKTSADDPDGELADREFHRAIAQASGNQALCYVIETMWKIRTEIEPVKEVYESVCSTDVGARGREHSEILDALRARNPVGARAAMRKHFTRLLESMLDVTEEKAFEALRRQTTESRRRYLKSTQI